MENTVKEKIIQRLKDLGKEKEELLLEYPDAESEQQSILAERNIRIIMESKFLKSLIPTNQDELVSVEIPAVCIHPLEKRENYHDSAILCRECMCIIEQFGEKIEPPHPLC